MEIWPDQGHVDGLVANTGHRDLKPEWGLKGDQIKACHMQGSNGDGGRGRGA